MYFNASYFPSMKMPIRHTSAPASRMLTPEQQQAVLIVAKRMKASSQTQLAQTGGGNAQRPSYCDSASGRFNNCKKWLEDAGFGPGYPGISDMILECMRILSSECAPQATSAPVPIEPARQLDTRGGVRTATAYGQAQLSQTMMPTPSLTARPQVTPQVSRSAVPKGASRQPAPMPATRQPAARPAVRAAVQTATASRGGPVGTRMNNPNYYLQSPYGEYWLGGRFPTYPWGNRPGGPTQYNPPQPRAGIPGTRPGPGGVPGTTTTPSPQPRPGMPGTRPGGGMPGTTTTPSPQRSWSPNLCYDDDLGGWIDCSKALLYWMSLCGPTEDFDLATMSCVPKGSARQSADQQYMSMQAQPALAPMSAMPQPRAGIPGTRPGPVGPNQYNPPQPLDVMGMGIMINPQERMMGMPMQPVVPGAAPQPPPKTCPPGYTLGPNGCVDASGNPPPSPGWPTIPTRLARPMQPFTPQAVPPAPTDQQLSCISDCRVKYRGQPGKMQACIGFCDEVHGRGVASFAQPRRRSIPRGVAQVQMPGGVIADASDVCFLYAEAKCQLLGYCSTDQWNAFEQECYQHLRKPSATGAPNLPAPGQQVPGGQTRLWSAARAGVCPEGLCLEGAAIGKPRCVECPEVELAAPVRTRRRRRRKTGLARLLNL